MPKWTTKKIRDLKGKERITCLTAADCTTASMLDAAGIQIILVGDSLAMTALGYDSTLPVTVAEMLHHTAAVARGVTEGLVVADMPFMSYQVSIEQALDNAGRFIKDSHADAVKIEGGLLRADTVRALVQNGIPVLGHIGLTPQNIKEMGGYRVQGRASKEADALIQDARALEEAGAFAIVLECIPAALGKTITESLQIPTIGIGAGKSCDGQVLVTSDLLGIQSTVQPKFVKRYAEVGEAMSQAFTQYIKEVKDGAFPADEHEY